MNEANKPNASAKRAVLYARVSSDDRGKDGRNLQGQLEQCRQYAQDKGYSVVAALSEDDRGASGASFELPGLNQVLEMAEAGEFDVLVPRELDRLSRNLAKQLVVEEELRRHGVQVEYALADYPDTPEGRLQKHLRATIAEYEREKINERMARGRRNKVKAGNVLVHGRPPFGYGVEEVDGKTCLVIHEREAQVVQTIFSWYVEGDEHGQLMSIGDIVRELSRMRVPTRADQKPDLHGLKKRGHGKWCRSTVHGMLRNETYAGIWRYGKTEGLRKGLRRDTPEESQISVEVPPIVSRESWDSAQMRLKENRRNAALNGRRKHKYLVGGHVTCGECGLKMAGSADGRAGRFRYYRCPSRHRRDAVVRKCNLPSFRADHVDAAVWGWIKSFLQNPEALEQGLWEVHQDREQENAPLRDRLAVIEDLLAENRTQLERLVDLYLMGEFPIEVLTERRSRLESTISALEREKTGLAAHLEEVMLSTMQIQTVKEFAARVADHLDSMDGDFNAMRGLVEALDVQVTLVIENDKKVVHARCIVGEGSWGLSDSTNTGPCQGLVILSWYITLFQ